MAYHAQTLLRKLDPSGIFMAAEKSAILEAPMKVAKIATGQDIVREGDRPHRSCLLVAGMMAAQKHTGDGNRQITSFYISGDIPDLQSLHLGVMDVTFQTITPCTVAYIPHDTLRDICVRYPRLASAFWRTTLIDAAIYREWVTNVGQRDAEARAAHLMCEIAVRSNVVGLADKGQYEFPLTQGLLGDALGLSVVHVNRTVQKLRRTGLIELKNKRLHILDWKRLAVTGDFDPLYLHVPEWAEATAALAARV